jgi:predicted S18 family serine protease
MIMPVITVPFLILVLLSAGVSANHRSTKVRAKLHDVTVITKNQSWPVKARIRVEPCRVKRCIDV